MTANPMQKKARSSFLLGVLLTLIIAAAVVGFLVVQLKSYKDKEAQDKANSVKVWVLGQDVKSGQIITTDMLTQQTTNKTLVPSNAIGNMSILQNYALTDKAGNEVTTEYKNNVPTLYITKNGQKLELKQEDGTDNYYTGNDDNKEYVELAETPIVAKVDLYKNSIITLDMIAKSDEKTTNDLRKVEYNMIVLPSQIQTGDYVDIRLSLPTGQDYIVVSKKEVEIPQVSGVDVENTIWLKLTEAEIVTMNNAIVESYNILGSTLKAVTYTEAGVQDKATPTYVPSAAVTQLIIRDPNIVQTAMQEIYNRYNSDVNGSGSNVRSAISSGVTNSGDDGTENVKTKVQESVTNSKEDRQKYLQSLGAGN